MILQQLLGSIPASQFMAEHFAKLPLAVAGGCRELAEHGTWSVVGDILAQPEADLIVSQRGKRWDGPPPNSADAGRALVAEGYTVGIRRAQRNHPLLASLAEDFHREFLAPIDIHLYCTPAGQIGFDWHYDAEEVFVLQTQGTKDWLLRKNTVHPWPLVETLPADMRYEREIMPLMRCTLAAGDWLYIPNGYWHRTEAADESISLSVGVLAPAAIDVFDFLRPRLLDSLRWRQRLPPLGPAAGLSPEELLLRYREILHELGQDLSKLLDQEATAADLLAKLAPQPGR